MKRYDMLKRCQYDHCHELFGRRERESLARFNVRKYCSVGCQEAANREQVKQWWADKREAAKKEDKPVKKVEPATYTRNPIRELLGPETPIFPAWTPRPKPPPLLSDAEQREIDRRVDESRYRRMEQPLTAEVCRRLGIAV